MTVAKIENYAWYDKKNEKLYASKLWNKLIEILDPEQSKKFKADHNDQIPLDVMVNYTQEKFLRKNDQRWLLENYNDFDIEIKNNLNSLLKEYDLIDEQPITAKTKYALFLGGSSANLCKRAFFLFDSIVSKNLSIKNIIVVGNTEPYDNFMDTIYKIICLYPQYFRDDLTLKDLPLQATMHEVMVFILDNLNWPQAKKPNLIELQLSHPSNFKNEADIIANYLLTNSEKVTASKTGFFPTSNSEKKSLVVISNQPFNDRQAITVLGSFVMKNLRDKFEINAAGPGLETYPLLNNLPASLMSSAQIVDNLSRTLYEISQNAQNLLIQSSIPKEEKCKNFMKVG